MNDKIKRLTHLVLFAIGVAAVYTFFISSLSGWPALVNMALMIVMTVGFYYLIDYLKKSYNASLTRRVDTNLSVVWIVSMNGIPLGTITDAQYASIQRTVFRDGRFLLAQTLNVLFVAWNIVKTFVHAIPAATFWFVLGVIYLSPESLPELARHIQLDDPAILQSSIQTLLYYYVLLSIASVFILGLLKRDWFGFINHYDGAVHKMIRQHFNVTTLDPIEMIPKVEADRRYSQIFQGIAEP